MSYRKRSFRKKSRNSRRKRGSGRSMARGGTRMTG